MYLYSRPTTRVFVIATLDKKSSGRLSWVLGQPLLSCNTFCEFGQQGSPFPSGASGEEPTCQGRRRRRCGFDSWVRKISLEEGMATHSSILAWRILWTEEPGRLQSMGLQRARHDWSNTAHMNAPFLALVHQVMRIKWDNIYENPLKGKKHKQNWKHKAQLCVSTEARILARILEKLYFL